MEDRRDISQLLEDLLFHIARYLYNDGESLFNYPLVCRRWQSVFEPLMYESPRVVSGYPEQSGTFSIFQFWSFVSNPVNRGRRAMVRTLEFYHYAAQYPASDVNTITTMTIPGQNMTDVTYRKAVVALFKILQLWEPSHKFALEVILSYHFTDQRAEPEATAQPMAFPIVQCIRSLNFRFSADGYISERIWEGTPFQIAQSCANITVLTLDSDAFQETSDSTSRLKQRNVIAECLGGLPITVETLGLRTNGRSNPYLLDFFDGDNDLFTLRIRDVSTHLRHLILRNVTLPVDFLCPLNADYSPRRKLLFWPHLRYLLSVDNFLIDGIRHS
ncbi:hypothetical protein BDW62DRAFT_124861 [Aspergillus aurantiobrunneus]